MFEHSLRTRFDDIDYAGRVFYVKAFEYVHEAEEHWFEALDYSMRTQKTELGVQFPVVDARAEFFEPMKLEDDLSIRLTASDMTEKSFTVDADAVSPDGETDVFSVHLVRVCMDVESETATPIPTGFRDALRPHVE